jgi:hypothetical protein
VALMIILYESNFLEISIYDVQKGTPSLCSC